MWQGANYACSEEHNEEHNHQQCWHSIIAEYLLARCRSGINPSECPGETMEILPLQSYALGSIKVVGCVFLQILDASL